MKVYKSKSGKEFSLVDYPRPAVGNVVYFTKREFEWMKSQSLATAEFDFLWLSKKEDYNFTIIPESAIEKTQTVAQRYCEAIKAMLLSGETVEIEKSESPPKVVEERGWEKRVQEKD